MVSELLEPGALGTAGIAAGYLTYRYLKGSHEAGKALADLNTEKVTEMEISYAEFIQDIDGEGFLETSKNFALNAGEVAEQIGRYRSIGMKGELLRHRSYLLEGIQEELWNDETTVGEYNHALAEGYEEII